MLVENFRTVETDVLVIGTGAAGMRAAVEAERNKAKVIVVDKGIATKSGCSSASAAPNARGIAGRHLDFKLILKIGCYLND
ncbi:MAG: FAD-binding protein, partial [Desulfobacterales bacterium]|nr:FAD-binding protein [Desulfobacterales bacterium]